MGVKLNVLRKIALEAKYVRVDVKVCDSGSYQLEDDGGEVIGTRDNDYVPNKVIPGEYGDYISLRIDLETGQITNWKVPTAKELRDAFKLDDDEEDK